MSNRSLAWLLGVAVVAGMLGCGPAGSRPRTAGDEESKSKNEARYAPLRVVWEHTEQFRACFEEARRSHSDLVLKSTIDMEVDGKGRVTRAFVTTAKPVDESLKKCMQKVAEGITFPPSGETFTVKPAFVFP